MVFERQVLENLYKQLFSSVDCQGFGGSRQQAPYKNNGFHCFWSPDLKTYFCLFTFPLKHNGFELFLEGSWGAQINGFWNKKRSIGLICHT